MTESSASCSKKMVRMAKDTEPPRWEAGQKTPPKWDFTFARFIIRIGVYLPGLNLVIVVEIAPFNPRASLHYPNDRDTD
jgi:hypothetical protein